MIMPSRLGAVAAGRHRAPAPFAGAAVVEEQPAAFGIGAALDLAVTANRITTLYHFWLR